MADPAPTTTNTKKPYYIAFATGSAFKFSGTKTIYTTEVITLLGITATVPANSKPFTGAASNFGISRVRVRYIKSGTIAADDAKYGVGTLLVAPAKLEEALKSLTTVKYKGKDITKGDKGDTGAQGIQGLKGDSAPLNHQHQIADVSGLQTALDSKSPLREIFNNLYKAN